MTRFQSFDPRTDPSRHPCNTLRQPVVDILHPDGHLHDIVCGNFIQISGTVLPSEFHQALGHHSESNVTWMALNIWPLFLYWYNTTRWYLILQIFLHITHMYSWSLCLLRGPEESKYHASEDLLNDRIQDYNTLDLFHTSTRRWLILKEDSISEKVIAVVEPARLLLIQSHLISSAPNVTSVTSVG